MLLTGKQAVIHGAGGSLGGAVARAFALEGAHVWLTGRTQASLDLVAADIRAAGGQADTAIVDALDEEQVNSFLQSVGRVDISFNAIDWLAKQDISLPDMTLEDFIRPIDIGLRTQFITATAAARIMLKQGSGVILSLTATPGGIGYPKVGGFGPACAGVESFSRDLAAELGPHGIRAVNIRSGGSPDSEVFRSAIEADPEGAKVFLGKIKGDTMLKTMPAMADVANLAVFLASTMDITCGSTTGLNNTLPHIPFV